MTIVNARLLSLAGAVTVALMLIPGLAVAAEPTTTPAGSMTLHATVTLAQGKPAPDGALITAYALPSQDTSNHASANPPACSPAATVSKSQATVVVDGNCAVQFASETGGQGVVGFGIAFTNDYGQPTGAGSLNHVDFRPNDAPEAVTINFDVDPGVKGIASGPVPSTSGAVAPSAPNTGTGVRASGGSLAWAFPLIFGFALLLLAAAILHRRRTQGGA